MKRSLHIGINNYPGTGSDLSGCVNDANDWREAFEQRGFQATTLLDEEAKKSNMVEAISKIVADTGKDDIAVITYSGHGSWVPDEEGDEADGRDEALCPYDIMEGNSISELQPYCLQDAKIQNTVMMPGSMSVPMVPSLMLHCKR